MSAWDDTPVDPRVKQSPLKSAWDATPVIAPMQAPDPSQGGGTLQVWNPFGANLDTGIPTTERIERGLAGAGKFFSDLGTGVKQRLTEAADAVTPHQTTLSDLIVPPVSASDKLRQQVAEQRRLDAPLMNTTAGKVGNFTAGAATMIPAAFIPGANTVAGAAAVGGGMGLLQPSESDAETLINTGAGGLGGAVGQKVANGVGSLVTALRGGQNLTPGQQAALQFADKLGFKTTPATRTGSKPLAQIEATLSSQPESSGAFNAVNENNVKALNRAAASSIGETADNLSSETLGRAQSRIGAVFDSVADKTPVPLDPQSFGPRLAAVLKDSEGMIGTNDSLANNGLFKRLDDFVNTQGGATREQLRDLSSKLGKKANDSYTTPNGDRSLGDALFKMKSIVEDAIQGTLTGDQKAAYASAREQYGNLMNLTARNSIVNPSSGNVNGRALASALMSKDKGGFTFGKNDSDLYNAARFVQAFPQLVNDSGTATRTPFSIGQIPSRLLGAVASPSYMAAGNMVSGQGLTNVPGWINKATQDPFAKELAALLKKIPAKQLGPTQAAALAAQAQSLINPPQQQ